MTILFQPVDIRRDVPFDDHVRQRLLIEVREMAPGDRTDDQQDNPATLAKDDPRYLDWRRRQQYGAAHRPVSPNNISARASAHAAAVHALGGVATVEQVRAYQENATYSTTARYLVHAVTLGLLTVEQSGRKFKLYRSGRA